MIKWQDALSTDPAQLLAEMKNFCLEEKKACPTEIVALTSFDHPKLPSCSGWAPLCLQMREQSLMQFNHKTAAMKT